MNLELRYWDYEKKKKHKIIKNHIKQKYIFDIFTRDSFAYFKIILKNIQLYTSLYLISNKK